MIDLGFQFVTISSDLRLLNANTIKILEEMKSITIKDNNSY